MSWLDKFFGKNYNLIQDDGILVPPEYNINFVNATVTDDPSNSRTNVEFPSGGPGGNNKTVQYNNNGVAGGIQYLTYEGSGRIQLDAATGYLTYGAGTVSASGFIRIPYSAAAKMLFGIKDSGGTDRTGLKVTGNAIQFGDSTGLSMNIQGSTLVLASAAGATLSCTTYGLTATLTASIAATGNLTLSSAGVTAVSGANGSTLIFAGSTSHIDLGDSPAASGKLRLSANPGNILVAGTKVQLAGDGTDLFVGVDTAFANGVGYVKIFGTSGVLFGLNGSYIGSIDSSGYCIAVNQQNWQFGSNVGTYGGGVCVGYWRAATTNPTSSPSTGAITYVDKDSFYLKAKMPNGDVGILDIPNPGIMGLRLTPRTGEPIPTTDTATATTIYLTPFASGSIMLYDATAGHWQLRVTNEVSLALGTLTSGKNYDVWATWSGSAVVLSFSTAWTNDTTRADAITRQNGVLVKSGTPALRYVGTIRTISTTQTTDTLTQRYIWNMYNQIERYLYVEDTTANWAYALTAYRQVRATASNKVEIVCGQVLPLVGRAQIVQGSATTLPGTGIAIDPGIGLDSTTTPFTKSTGFLCQNAAVSQWNPAQCEGDVIMGIGYHAVNWLEACNAANSINGFGLVGHFQSHMRCRAWM